MATEDQASQEQHETNPGMDGMTLIYCALFFLLYIFYFYQVSTGWKVGP